MNVLTVARKPAQLTLRCLDVDVDVQVEDGVLADTLERLCQALQEHGGTGTRSVTVAVRGHGPWSIDSPAHRAETEDVPAAVTHALTAINLSMVEATGTYAVHAAVLTRQDSTLVVPAISGMGKSTLTVALLQQGWHYVSDEALGILWDGRGIVGYPRAISLSPWSAQRLGVEGEPGIGETHLAPVWPIIYEPGRVTHVLLLSRDGAEPHVAAAHRADVVTEMLRRSFTHYVDPPRALDLLADLVRGATVATLHLGDPVLASELVTRWATD